MGRPLSGGGGERLRITRARQGDQARMLRRHALGIPLGTQEIAVALGCSREYVRLLYNSAMRKLRAALLDQEPA